MELANLIVPMKHICMILNLLNINCNLTASTLQTVLFFSKTIARKKSRATVNLVPRDFLYKCSKKTPETSFFRRLLLLKNPSTPLKSLELRSPQ